MTSDKTQKSKVQRDADHDRFIAFQKKNSERTNKKAFKEYWSIHKRGVYLFADELCRDKKDANEATIWAFSVLWEKRLSLTSPKHLVCSLYRAARNAAIHIVRERARILIFQNEFANRRGRSSNRSNLKIIESEIFSHLTMGSKRLKKSQIDLLLRNYSKKLSAKEVSELKRSRINYKTVDAVWQPAVRTLRHGLRNDRLP